MKGRGGLIAGSMALALAGAGAAALIGPLASAQERPESLLPPGFDDPVPTPTPTAEPSALPVAPPRPVAPALPDDPDEEGEGPEIPSFTFDPLNLPPALQLSEEELAALPTLDELEELTVDELDDLLGLKPQFDIPPAARRSLSQVGLLARAEGGFPRLSLARQPDGLVRAVLAGTRGPLVSRWGHILLRRALVSRLAAPEGMNPVEFAALRAGVLNSLGEFTVSRAFVQDVDTGAWNTALTSEALTAYIASADFVGICPAVRLQGSAREDERWRMLQAICNAYAGEGALAGAQLDAALGDEIAPQIDVLLAQRYAGAAGRGRRAVSIEWDGVEDLTPWRFGLANAVGETVPQNLLDIAYNGEDAAYYLLATSSAPMLPLPLRETGAQAAAARGVLSAQAMVDLYSLIYADNQVNGEAAARATALREAYVGANPSARIAAMQSMWGEGEEADYAALITTAYAAARIPPSSAHNDEAGALITSMLAAGLDRDAASWSGSVETSSLGWVLVGLADPEGGILSEPDVDGFVDDDQSAERRKSAFLIAGLAGLGRISDGDFRSFANRLDIDFARQTRWTRMITKAADVDNAALVTLLAGFGMQGESWSQMTPLYLYHIVTALRRVGLEAEARMIAAEAVARG